MSDDFAILLRRRLLRSIFHGFFLALLAISSRTVQAAPPGAQPAPPTQCLVGGYITGISDFNFSAQTFDAQVWLWTVTPVARNLKPLDTMEFPNAVKTTSSLESRADVHGQRWDSRKLTGTFHHHWDLRNFPFDRHVLQIRMEEAVDGTSTLVYTPDVYNSFYNKEMELSDWKVVGFSMASRPVAYATTFGDPRLAPNASSEYAGVSFSMIVQRKEMTSYFKLTAVAYVSFLLALIGCFMHMDKGSQGLSCLGTRITLIAGALFACVLNMRSTSAALGSEDGITLVDKVHILVLIYILLLSILAVFNRDMLVRGWDEQKLKLADRWAVVVAFLTFMTINMILMVRAANVG